MLNVDLVGCASFCPHALKGQKLLAQGIALGNYGRPLSPCKGKSFKLVIAFLRTTMQRYGNFLILPNFTLQSYVKQI